MSAEENEHEAIQKVFMEALRRPKGAERDAYLEAACAGEDSLRASLEALLKEYEEDETNLSSSDPRANAQVESDDAPMFVPGTVLAGRYRIVSLLGKGGMGEVYRADDLKLDQAVALKFLPQALAEDPQLLQALHNEVRLARHVAHRHVSRVYDIGEAEGHHFLSMEYIEGDDLAGLLRQVGRLPLHKALVLAKQLCAGLQAAHEENLLHLDLKPGNLMIDKRGDLRITDFGLAQWANDAERSKRRAGTPAYMAPEQLLEGRATRRSDLYAIGLILYEMSTGQRFHGRRTAEELVSWHQSNEGPRVASNNLPAELTALIRRCAARSPAERPENVSELLAALEPLLTTHEAEAPSAPLAAPKEPPSEELKFSDVFINYAPVDNQPLAAGRLGWVEQFHDHLKVRLEQLSGESIKIWRHLAPQQEEPDEDILERLPEVKTMVSVVSPPFVKTPVCLREMETFWRGAQRNGTFRISDKTRILKVTKTPVPTGVAPPEVERLMAQLGGFDFFEKDQETGRILPYDETLGERAMQRYFERVYDLAYEIRDLLHALGHHGTGPGRTASGRTVYLAETTADLLPEHDKLKRELLESGHRVLPELPLPIEGAEFEREVELQLGEADFAIHLVGERYGMVPEGTDASVVEIQNRLAADRCATADLQRIIWMPRGLVPQDERQATFVRRLKEAPEAHRGGEVVQEAMATFKRMLRDTLAPPEEASAEPSPSTGKADVPSIYLIYDRRDEESVEPLEDLLFELGFEVTTPSFEGDEKETKQIHRHNLQHCDGALVYYGSVSRPWVEMKLMDIAQAPGYGRNKDLLASAVYVAPSDDRRKARFRTHLADVIRPDAEKLNAVQLNPFTEALRA